MAALLNTTAQIEPTEQVIIPGNLPFVIIQVMAYVPQPAQSVESWSSN